MEITEVMNSVLENTQIVQTPNPMDGKKSSDDKFYEAWKEDADALKAEKARKLREESNLGLRFKRRTFETFDASADRNAYDKCLEYVARYKKSERNSLLVVGGYGSGKTHLVASIANRLMDEGVPVLFDTFGGHLNKLKLEFNGGRSVYLQQMKTVDMLVLDDIGKEKQTEWSQSIMFDVINYRYEHLLPIIITTNLTHEALANYLGGAVWSRLCEMCVGVTTVGSDYRRK